MHRAGMVAIVGRPNVGKSSLLNELVGTSLSITSRKAQTTRHRILGVRTMPDHQILFVDTPGIQHLHQAALNRHLNKSAIGAMSDVDAVLWVIEARRLLPQDERVLSLLPLTLPVVVAMNKSDLLKTERDKAQAFAIAQALSEARSFSALVPVSAVKGFQVDVLANTIAGLLAEQPPLMEADAITDRSIRFLCAELIREKLFRLMGDEVPYEATVIIERFSEATPETRRIEIDATIVVARASQKPMVIGEGGERIRRIGSEARQDIIKLVEQPVHLQLWVKVKENWSDDDQAVRSFGYE
jgi:GTP-binding protein Era